MGSSTRICVVQGIHECFRSKFKKDEPIEPRFLEGEGSQRMGGILYVCVGGGVEAMLTKNF